MPNDAGSFASRRNRWPHGCTKRSVRARGSILLGSVLDPDRFRTDSDLDLAIGGLEPEEYWEAWRIVEPLAEGTRIDLIRLETAAERLRQSVLAEGEELP